MGWTDQIDVADEHFHPKSDDPYWSENTLLGFTVPERNMCGFIYYYFRPNMNLVVAGPAIWDNTRRGRLQLPSTTAGTSTSRSPRARTCTTSSYRTR